MSQKNVLNPPFDVLYIFIFVFEFSRGKSKHVSVYILKKHMIIQYDMV